MYFLLAFECSTFYICFLCKLKCRDSETHFICYLYQIGQLLHQTLNVCYEVRVVKGAGWENDGIPWAAEGSPLSHVEKAAQNLGIGAFSTILFGSCQFRSLRKVETSAS